MKKRLFLCFLVICFSCGVLACSCTPDTTIAKTGIYETALGYKWDDRSLDDREFLIEVVGFTAEQLENIDIEVFSRFVDLRKTKDLNDVRNFAKYSYDTEYDMFYNENYNDTYLILSVLPNDKIPKGTKIKKIGFNYNPGTFVEDSVFDIEKGVFYVYDRGHIENKYDEYQLDVDLSNIVDEYEIYNWDTVIEGPQDDTTASYGWKLVFLGDDGHKYAYEGYTMSKNVFPEGYKELSKKLNEIIKKVEILIKPSISKSTDLNMIEKLFPSLEGAVAIEMEQLKYGGSEDTETLPGTVDYKYRGYVTISDESAKQFETTYIFTETAPKVIFETINEREGNWRYSFDLCKNIIPEGYVGNVWMDGNTLLFEFGTF